MLGGPVSEENDNHRDVIRTVKRKKGVKEQNKQRKKTKQLGKKNKEKQQNYNET